MRYLLICLLPFFLDRFSYVKHFARQLHSSSRSSYRKIVNQSQLGRTSVSYQSLHEKRNIGRKLCDWKITTKNCFAGNYIALKFVEWLVKYIHHRQNVVISIKDLLFYISKVAAKVMLDESIKTMEEEMKNFDELQRVEDPPRKIN